MIKLLLLAVCLIGAYGEKQKLPVDWVKQPHSNIECGKDVKLSEMGYARFNLNSKDKECPLKIIGSKSPECTATVHCDGSAGWTPIGPEGVTGKDFMKIYDQANGDITGYGDFFMGNLAMTAREGVDLLIKYRGVSKQGFECVFFCKEDITDAHGLKVDKIPAIPTK